MLIAGRSVAGVGAARSVLAAGVAVVSVGVVSASPVEAPLPAHPMSTQAYTLAASSALLNVPVNLFNMALSMPAWEVQAMNRFADAMIDTGSWQVWGPTNVFGFDGWDPPKLAGVIDMMMPVQPFSSVLGDQINWWAKANFPMNAGCAAAPGACPDFGTAASGYLKVPASQLNKGYQFPTVTNPFTLQPTSWSGQYVKLDPGAAFTSLWNYLSSDPRGVQTAPIGDYFSVPLKLAKSMFDAYYPFVQNSEWFNPRTPFSWAFRALAPLTCPSCGPEPYDNPWLYQNFPPKPAGTSRTPAPAATVDAVAAVAPTSLAPAAGPVSMPAAGPVNVQADHVAAVAPPAAERVKAPAAPAAGEAVDRADVTEPPATVPDAPVSAPSTADGGVTGHRGPVGADRSPTRTTGTHAKTRGHSGQSGQA